MVVTLFFVSAITFVFVRLCFVCSHERFSGYVLDLTFLDYLVCFIGAIVVVRRVVRKHLADDIIRGSVTVCCLFHRVDLYVLVFLTLIGGIDRGAGRHGLFSGGVALYVDLFFIFKKPVITRVLSDRCRDCGLRVTRLAGRGNRII